MFGRICCLEKRGWRVRLVREEILGLTLLRAEVPAPVRPRRLKKAARLLAGQGIRRVVAPPGFGDWPLLRSQGLEPVETAGLCQAMGARLAQAALRERGLRASESTVALRAQRVTRALRLTALALCPVVRRVVVTAPGGGDALRAELRREFGVPAVEESRSLRPDVALHFGEAGGGGQTVFRLYGAEPDLAGFMLTPAGQELPADCDRLPILAALWETGRLSCERLDVISCSGT